MWTSSTIPSEAPVVLAVREGDNMIVYCAVENNQFELIRFMADTIAALARDMKMSASAIYSYKSRGQSVFGLKIIEVEIDDEGEN